MNIFVKKSKSKKKNSSKNLIIFDQKRKNLRDRWQKLHLIKIVT